MVKLLQLAMKGSIIPFEAKPMGLLGALVGDKGLKKKKYKDTKESV